MSKFNLMYSVHIIDVKPIYELRSESNIRHYNIIWIHEKLENTTTKLLE